MADNIPRKLVNLPEKMELEFKNKLPYPADAKKYMLDLYKKIEKNLSLSKRAKRKISKTFKKVFTNEDPEKGSLKNENKTFLHCSLLLMSIAISIPFFRMTATIKK